MTVSEEQTVIYLGASEITVLTGSVDAEPRLLRHKRMDRPEGFSSGLVTNLDRAAASLESLIQGIASENSSLPSRLPRATASYVVLGNSKIKTYTFASSQYYHGFRRTITPYEVQSVIEQTKSVATLPLNEFVLQVVPVSFVVNDLEDVDDPIGLDAQRLGVMLKIFTMPFEDFKNISRALELAEIPVKAFYPKTLTASQAVLTEKEKEEGTLLLDIDASNVYITYWKKGEMVDSRMSPYGHAFLTSAIAKKWEVSFEDAEHIKTRFVSFLKEATFGDELIPLIVREGKEHRHISRQDFHQALHEFSKEWLSKVFDDAQKFASDEKIFYPNYVLTGGGSAFDGLIEFIQEEFALPVRLGYSKNIGADYSSRVDLSFTASLGMLSWLAYEHREKAHLTQPHGILSRTFESARSWFATYF